MSEVEFLASEDLGFKLESHEQGLPVFDQAIDVEMYSQDHLNLLAVGNVNRYIAVSNVTSLKLDTIDALASSLKTVAGSFHITQLHFNSDESRLYIVNHSKLYYVNTNDYFKNGIQELQPYDKDESKVINDIKSISVSPKSSESVLIHTKSGELYLNDKSGIIGESIAVYTWSDDGSIFYLNNNSKEIHCKYYTKEVIIIEDSDVDDDAQVIDIRSVKSQLLVTFKNEETDETQTFLIDSEGKAMSADVAPPFNSVERVNEYYDIPLVNWIPETTLYFVTSSLATEISTIKFEGAEIATVEPEDDSQRAQFPIDDETGDDTSAVGIAIDLTGTDTNVLEPWNGIKEVKGKLPRLLTLLNSGHLISWWIYDKTAVTNDQANLSNALKYYQKEKSAVVTANPFGSSTANSFGNAITSQSIDSSTSNSLFSKTDSPFGGFKAPIKEEKSLSKDYNSSSAFGNSSFGVKSEKPSPFAKLTSEKKPETGSGLSFGSSGFGSSGASASSFGGSGFGSTGFGGFAAKKPAALGSTQKSNAASSFGSYSSGTTNDSPFAKFAQSDSTASSPFASMNSQGGLSVKKDETKTSIFGSTAGSEIKTEASPFAKFTNKGTLPSPFDTLKDPLPQKSPALESPIPISGLSLNQNSSVDIVPSFQNSLKLSEDVIKPSQETSESEFEEDTEASISETMGSEENGDDEEEEEEEEFESEDVTPDNVSTLPVVPINVQKEKLDQIVEKPITQIDLLKFDGILKKGSYSNNILENKILEIYNETSGNINILESNVEALKNMIDSQSIEIQDPKLDSPDQWTLQSIGILKTEIDEEIDNSKRYLKTLKQQENELKSITDRLHKTHQLRIQLDRHFSQLSLFRNDAKSSILKKRPLSLKDEELQNKLREKISKFRDLENQIVAQLMPLKANIRLDDKVVKNLETTIFQIHSTLINHEETISELIYSLAQTEGKDTKEHPDSLSEDLQAEASYNSRWAASDILKTRKVAVRKIVI